MEEEIRQELYLWSHVPVLESRIVRRVDFCSKINDEYVDEAGVFELENGKYIYVRFSGNKNNLNEGFTDIEEFENLDKALEVFKLYQ